MPRPRLPYYETVKTLREGEVREVRCATHDMLLERRVWQGRRRGILYEFRGLHCPADGCETSKEEAAVLLGDEG